MTTDSTAYAGITGPAVTLDPAALHSWLATPTGDDSSRAGELGIDEFFSRAHGCLLTGLDHLLAALTDDDQQTGWRLPAGIAYVGFFRTFDGDTGDGATVASDDGDSVVDLGALTGIESGHVTLDPGNQPPNPGDLLLGGGGVGAGPLVDAVDRGGEPFAGA